MIGTCIGRRCAALLAAAATVFAALLPPTHIHLSAHDDHDHDHAGAVEHAHWSSHGSSHATFDDDDGRVIVVNRPAVKSHADTAIARPPAAVIALLAVPAPPRVAAAERLTSGNSPRDGPARDRSTRRGPPRLAL